MNVKIVPVFFNLKLVKETKGCDSRLPASIGARSLFLLETKMTKTLRSER
jgi:hypothetical protein